MLALLLAGSALAEDETPEKIPEPEPLVDFEAAQALTDTELKEQRAAAKIEVDRVTVNTSEQDGDVTSNAAIGNHTGRNSIGGYAFSSANGFINAVQNTGNNVLIQNSTIINVSVEK